MDDTEQTPVTPSCAWYEVGWKAAAVVVVLAGLVVRAVGSGDEPWLLFQHLSGGPVSVMVALLLLLTTLLWIASLLALPLWLAWLTDARSSSSPHQYTPFKPANLNTCRQAMADIKANTLGPQPDLYSAPDAVNASVDEVIRLIIRDFVSSWHAPLLSGSPNTHGAVDATSPVRFPAMVEWTIRQSLSTLIHRASMLDLAYVAVCKVLPKMTNHLKLFEEAEMKWRGSGSAAEIAEGEEGDVFLAALYNGGRLHPAVGNISSPDTKVTELEHLRSIAVRVLNLILPEKEARSRGVQIVVRELIACTILKPAVEVLSDPDMLNALLEEKASEALQEQKLVSRLREALDKEGSHVRLGKLATTTTSSSSSGTSTPRHKDDGKGKAATTFDSFMDDISSSKSILEARRTKNGLLQQIRKTKAAMGEETGERTKRQRLDVYLQRLHAAVEAVDRRILHLSTSSSIQEHDDRPLAVGALSQLAETVTLRDVLTSPSAISHFLEFAESSNHSILVQFWLSVNSFKNPLEVAESDSEDERVESDRLAREEEARMLREDLLFFVEHYYRSGQIVAVVKQKHIAIAETFLNSETRATHRSIVLVRKSVLKAQKQVYDEMVEEDWAAFQQSQGWHRALEDLQRERAEQAPTATFSTSAFLDHSRSSPPRSSASRAASHATLFGTPSNSVMRKGSSSDLFGPDEEEQTVGPKSPGLRSQSSLDQLMGGKGGTFDGLGGRAPLFREALFDDEDAQSGAEDERGNGKESSVRVDNQIDAIENVLSSIIREGLPPSGNRPTTDPRLAARRSDSGANRAPYAGEEEGDEVVQEGRTPAALDLDEAPVWPRKEASGVDAQSQTKRINEGIKRLQDQDVLLSTLMRKSELTGSSAKEMRLLQKSKDTIARELRALKFEKTTLGTHEQEQASAGVDIAPGRARVQIQHVNISQDSEGKEFATYLIEISKLTRKKNGSGRGEDVVVQSGWVLSRRYNEFYALHQRLRDKLNQVRALDHVFPGKRLTGLVNLAFVENRRVNLQRYLQELIKWEAVCKSTELKSFLSQSVPVFSVEALDRGEGSASTVGSNLGLVSRLYRGVTGVAEGLDDLLFGPSMFEVIVNRLSTGVVDLVGFNEMERILAGATTSSAAEIKEATQVTSTPFPGPICDAIIELFQLKLEGNWFRRQAIVIVAQQALGDTIERKLRQTVTASLLESSAIVSHLGMVKRTMWPNGRPRLGSAPRSLQEKRIRRDNALKKLSTLIPSVASNFIGRDNARRAARRSWAVLQNKRLNKHILYTIMDQVLEELFADQVAS